MATENQAILQDYIGTHIMLHLKYFYKNPIMENLEIYFH